MEEREKVAIRRLKEFALSLPHDHPLRDVLLAEDDELGVQIFLSRIPLWLRLARISRKPMVFAQNLREE